MKYLVLNLEQDKERVARELEAKIADADLDFEVEVTDEDMTKEEREALTAQLQSQMREQAIQKMRKEIIFKPIIVGCPQCKREDAEEVTTTFVCRDCQKGGVVVQGEEVREHMVNGRMNIGDDIYRAVNGWTLEIPLEDDEYDLEKEIDDIQNSVTLLTFPFEFVDDIDIPWLHGDVINNPEEPTELLVSECDAEQSLLLIEWSTGSAYTLECPCCQSHNLSWVACLHCPDCDKFYFPFVISDFSGVNDSDGEENREYPCYVLRNKYKKLIFLTQEEFDPESNHIIGYNTTEVYAEDSVTKPFETIMAECHFLER